MSIQCPSCKAYLAISKPVTCPRCSASLPEATAASAKPDLHGAAKPVAGTFVMAVRFSIVAASAFVIYRVAVPTDQQLYERKVAQALAGCQRQLVGLAKYGDADTPPFVENHGRNGEFYFAWPSGSFHFKNGFRAASKMSASCIGDVSTGEIKQLTLNGEDML